MSAALERPVYRCALREIHDIYRVDGCRITTATGPEMSNPVVFFDIEIGGKPAGRVEMEVIVYEFIDYI